MTTSLLAIASLFELAEPVPGGLRDLGRVVLGLGTDGDVMAGASERSCQGRADVAGTDDRDVHDPGSS